MEKTLARAIYKLMEIGKEYTTRDLSRLIGDDYYRYIPTEMQGKKASKIISAEMWKVVKSGYAKTYTQQETCALVGGLRFGATPTCFETYTFRYWIRIK